jgi:hypothetical protein
VFPRVPRIALIAVALGAAWAAAAGAAAGQAGQGFPPCPPGSPPLPPPGVTAQGPSRDAPGRIVAGRPFTLTYDERVVGVQDTAAATPGTTFDSPLGSLIIVTVPTPGPASFTVRYYDGNATRTTACLQSSTFTINLEAGDPVSGRLGAIEGTEPRWPLRGPPRLPKRGFLASGPPFVGALWTCSATTGRIPVTAELFVERALTRRPGPASPSGRLTVPDPCGTQSTTAAPAPGATLRFYGDPDVDAGERTLAVQHRFKGGARYWLRITQAGRLVGQLRYYTAFRAQRGRFAATWVIAPEAAFEAARCRRPRREDPETPLGFRKFPIPPCPR